MSASEFISRDEAAAMLRVHPMNLPRWAEDGLLEARVDPETRRETYSRRSAEKLLEPFSAMPAFSYDPLL